jgi:site-specific DNA recombinase
MHRCAIYARFSTDRQSENSAEDQISDCRRFAESKGWTVAGIFTDLAISGARNRRPGVSAMLAEIAAGSFDIVLVEDQDRLARDQEDIAAIYKRVTFAGGRIVTLAAGEINELHIGLKGTMDALELKKIAEKIRRGQRGAVSRGSIPGGLCYGYEVVRGLDDKGEPLRGRRRIVPEQAAIVRRIMEEYADGRGPKAICRGLNEDGIPAARGGLWLVSAIMGNRARRIGILHNPIYVGQFVYNRVRMLRDPDTRNRISRPNADSELEIVELPELRIVSDDLWNRVQQARGDRASAPLLERRRPKHLLSGLVRCGTCGGAYAIYSKNRIGCTSHRGGGLCANSSTIAIEDLQRRVLGGLEQKLLGSEAVSLLVREYHAQRERKLREDGNGREKATKRLKDIEAAIARLVAAIADGGAGFADIRQLLAAKTAERDRLRAELAEEEALPVIALHPRIADAYRERVKAVIGGLQRGEILEGSSAGQIRSLVDTVVIRPGNDGCDIEVVSSLESAVALAISGEAKKKGSARTALTVSDLRYQIVHMIWNPGRFRPTHRYPRNA